ncbi:MAG TPA: anti-sigma regulatory factor [Chitinophagaceae bacterium]|nr:anti-sigma regulatory factor [Chitinophagaceae bacterium]
MVILNKEVITIKSEQDAVFFRNRVTEHAVKIRMTLINQTKLLTAASELLRNMLRYAGTGIVVCEVLSALNLKTGIRLTFIDKGPGIKNLEEAMKDGFSTTKSLGIGLPGAKRLVNEFEIESSMEKGTSVMILKWQNV